MKRWTFLMASIGCFTTAWGIAAHHEYSKGIGQARLFKGGQYEYNCPYNQLNEGPTCDCGDEAPLAVMVLPALGARSPNLPAQGYDNYEGDYYYLINQWDDCQHLYEGYCEDGSCPTDKSSYQQFPDDVCDYFYNYSQNCNVDY